MNKQTHIERNRKMNLRNLTLIGIVTMACLLARPAAVNADNQVPRPVKVLEGHLTITVDALTGEYEFVHLWFELNSGSLLGRKGLQQCRRTDKPWPFPRMSEVGRF
jgi:hypothetical protein